MKLNIYTTGSQIIECVGECGSKIHLVSNRSFFYISIWILTVKLILIISISYLLTYILTNNTSNNNTLFNKKSYSNNNTNLHLV